MSNGSRLPARSNFRRGNRRGGSQTLNATNVPQVRGSVDQGQRIPDKGLFGEYETANLANTGAGLMNLGNTVFNVSTKLKQREDKRFLLQAEDELDANIKSLIENSKEALDLSNSEDIKGLNGKLETIFKNYDEKANKVNLSPNSAYDYEGLKNKFKNNFAVEIAKEKTLINHQRDQGRVYGLADGIGLDPLNDDMTIEDNFNKFKGDFESKYAGLIDEKTEPELIRQSLQRITTRKIDRLLLDDDEKNLANVKKLLDSPEVWELQYQPDGEFDSKFSQTLNAYRTRVKGVEDGRSDVSKRFAQVKGLQEAGILPKDPNSPEVKNFVLYNKKPDKTPEAKKLEAYQAALKNAPKGEDGIILPTAKAVIDDAFDMGKPEGYDLKRANFLKWKEDNPKASTEEIAVAESTFMGLPMSPEVEASLKAKGAIALAAAASGATTQAIQAMGLEVPKDNLEQVKQVEAEIKFLKSKGIEISKEQEKRFYMEKAGLKEKVLSPIEQVYKDADDLRDKGIFISIAETNLLAKQKAGFKLSELEQKQAIEIEARINSFKTVQEAKGVVEGVEKIEDPNVKKLVEKKLDLDVPPEKQNAVEKLQSRIDTAEKAGVILSDADKELLIKKEIGNIPLTEEEREKEAKLKGKLEGITEKAKDEELGVSIGTGVDGKDSKKMNTLIVQRLGGEVNPNSGTVTLSPEKTKVALAVLVKAENFYGTKKADSLGQAVEMAFDETKIPETKSTTTIADDVIKNAERGTPLATGEELENAPSRLKEIKLDDATGIPSAAINIWNSTFGQISEKWIDKDVVRARQKLALLEGDFISAFKRSPRLPVWEQKRLASIFSGPEVWTSPGEVREAMKDVDEMLTEEITFQRALLDNENMPFKEKREALKNISTLARFRKRVREFELDPMAKFQDVKSIENASQEELVNFANSVDKESLMEFGNKNPKALKLLRKRLTTGSDTSITLEKKVGKKKKNQNPLEAFRSENNIEVTEGKGEGFAEVLFAGNDGKGRNIIEFRKAGNFKKQDIIDAETLHFMGGSKEDGTPYHEEFFDLKQQFINSMSFESKEFAQRKYAKAKKEGMTGTNFSNFENYVQNVFSDMELRGAMFPQLMTDPKERKDFKSRKMFTTEQKAILKQMDKLVKGE